MKTLWAEIHVTENDDGEEPPVLGMHEYMADEVVPLGVPEKLAISRWMDAYGFHEEE